MAVALNDLDVTGWLSVVPYPDTAADFQHFRTGIAKPGETFAVLDATGLAGIVGAGRALGYWFALRCHGMGYATEAISPAGLIGRLSAGQDGTGGGTGRVCQMSHSATYHFIVLYQIVNFFC